MRSILVLLATALVLPVVFAPPASAIETTDVELTYTFDQGTAVGFAVSGAYTRYIDCPLGQWTASKTSTPTTSAADTFVIQIGYLQGRLEFIDTHGGLVTRVLARCSAPIAVAFPPWPTSTCDQAFVMGDTSPQKTHAYELEVWPTTFCAAYFVWGLIPATNQQWVDIKGHSSPDRGIARSETMVGGRPWPLPPCPGREWFDNGLESIGPRVNVDVNAYAEAACISGVTLDRPIGSFGITVYGSYN